MKPTIFTLLLTLFAAGCNQPDMQATYNKEIEACDTAEKQGLLASAANACQRALDSIHDDPLANTAKSQTLFRLARIKRQQAKYKDAELLLTQSLTLEDNTDKPDSDAIAQRLYELSLCLAGQNRWLDGTNYIKRMLSVIENLPEKTQVDSINLLKQYARQLRKKGETDQADYFEEQMALIKIQS